MGVVGGRLQALRKALATVSGLNERLDEIKIAQGTLLSLIHRDLDSAAIQDYEFKVFSQCGDDGIIQYLSRTIGIKNRTFIEFGVEDFFESNCRFLLMKDNWSGFVIDGSAQNIAKLKGSYFYWKHDLEAIDAFVTRDNIDGLLRRSGFDEDLGILSIDLDGNDYYVLEAIKAFRPRILICEYNGVFGSERPVSVPYDPQFVRTRKHYSNLYFGASLAALTWLANVRGYSLIGTNSAGLNAYFLRNDLVTERMPAMSAAQAYLAPRFRESRDPEGNLTHAGERDRLELIRGLPVWNVVTRTLETL